MYVGTISMQQGGLYYSTNGRCITMARDFNDTTLPTQLYIGIELAAELINYGYLIYYGYLIIWGNAIVMENISEWIILV